MTAGEGGKKNEQPYVLIVGADSDLRNIIGINALSIGISPRYATDGTEALAVLESQVTDFIISDILMPKMNGIALLAEIRRRGSSIPFLVLSKHADKELVLAAYRLGIFDYLEKPIDNNLLKFMMMEASKLAAEIYSPDSSRLLTSRKAPEEGGEEQEETVLDESVMEKLAALDKGKVERKKTPSTASGKEKNPLVSFANESLAQLEHTENAIRGLHNEKCDWELGFLSRVMSSMLVELRSLQQDEIPTLVRVLNQCFSLYRIRTSMLTHRELSIIKRAHKILVFRIADLLVKTENPLAYPISEDLQAVTKDLRNCISL